MFISEYLLFATAFLIAVFGSLYVKRRNQKKSGLPEADERTIHLFQVYTLRITLVFGVIGVISLAVLTLQKHTTIDINAVWLYLLVFMFALSAGALLVKHK